MYLHPNNLLIDISEIWAWLKAYIFDTHKNLKMQPGKADSSFKTFLHCFGCVMTKASWEIPEILSSISFSHCLTAFIQNKVFENGYFEICPHFLFWKISHSLQHRQAENVSIFLLSMSHLSAASFTYKQLKIAAPQPEWLVT